MKKETKTKQIMKKETKTKQIIAEVIREERQKHFNRIKSVALYFLIGIMIMINALWGFVLIEMFNPERVVTGAILFINFALLIVLVTKEK